jgi:hypothetical protein
LQLTTGAGASITGTSGLIYSNNQQSFNVAASVTDSQGVAVNSGTVTFNLYFGTTLVNYAVGVVNNGTATATITLPSRQAAGTTYHVVAVFNGGS